MKILLTLSIGLLLFSCAEKPLNAEEIIEASIAFHGLDTLDHSKVQFTFREMKFEHERDGSKFNYTRVKSDSLGNQIEDRLWNKGFERKINDSMVDLDEKQRISFGESVNSVHYFAFMPLRLRDKAAMKNLVGTCTIKGKEYHKIKVTFQPEGGGRDFDDVFFYYFRTENHQLDYFAYKYNTNGGGIRFREAVNSRDQDGIQIQDYINMKPKNEAETDFSNIEESYSRGDLEELSKIEIEDFQFAPVNQ